MKSRYNNQSIRSRFDSNNNEEEEAERKAREEFFSSALDSVPTTTNNNDWTKSPIQINSSYIKTTNKE